ncbi:MAG TPA: cytochrome C [Alphaproteobacteria bacterium]|nr:cytochrome C [Alphaproteobacteria bacterium]
MPDFAKKHRHPAAILSLLVLILPLSRARGLPAFARQTGLECADCHTAFPELTPVGRRFKLNGYTQVGADEISFPDHLAAMVEGTYTHTEAGQPGGAAPHFGPNNNLVLQQTSLFYGGKLADNLGAFVQTTYDDVSKRFGWDNTDIRYADRGSLFGYGLVWGISANNNPTVQDVWNSTPAWRFPYISSELAPTPGAATLIEGGLGQQVAGISLYGFLDDWIYAEFGFYHDLSKRTLTTLGVDTTGVNGIDGAAPYWRVALEPHWGKHWLELGTFGLAADVVPARVAGFGTDSITDTGVDFEYQYMGDPGIVSARASWIRETRDLGASFAQGLADNRHGSLESFNASATYTWKQMITGTVGRFQTNGNSDLTLNGTPTGSPNSDGWTFEIAYLPFMHGGPSFWPWLNARIGIQYTIYDKFNGSRFNIDGNGRFASDNNTLFTYIWIAF